MSAMVYLNLYLLVVFILFSFGVRSEPCQLLLSSDSQQSIVLGSNGHVSCKVSPECDMSFLTGVGPTWIRTDREWIPHNVRVWTKRQNQTMATLYYNNIEEEDLGTYQCSAEFQFGMLKNTVNFTERIEGKCELQLNPSCKSVNVSPGSNGKLSCSFSSECDLSRKRVISPYWTKTIITNSRRIVFINLKPTVATLFYNGIQNEDLGEYQCHALVGEQQLMASVILTYQSSFVD